MRRFLYLTTAIFVLGMALACGGGGSATFAPTGTLSLRLGTDSFPGYDQVVVSLERVEASPDGYQWTPLGDVKATFDLMALQNGHAVTILPATRVNAGTYSKFRLTWATMNYQDQTRQAAYVLPSGAIAGQILTMPATTVVSGLLTISANQNTTAQIMLDGQPIVQERAGVQPFRFVATGRAYDLSTTATLVGKVSATSGPLAGVEVFAETVDGLGTASLQRRAFSDATGNFTLEALPIGATYFAVSQPAGPSTCFVAAASAPVDARAANTYRADLSFTSPVGPGSLNLTIAPASLDAQVTWAELRQTLATGASGSQILIVRSQPAASGVAQDQLGLLNLAPGLYGLIAQRSTSGGTPALKVGPSVTIYTATTTNTSLSYP